MKILIVDDSAFMRTILKTIIAKTKWHDATVLEAENGEMAVKLFHEEQPELVLLDVVMPLKNGIDVLKEIGQTAQSVVMVSSVDQKEVIDEAKGLGAKDYIVKPFDAKQVVDVLDTVKE